MSEQRSKIPRRQIDKDRYNILRGIKDDFQAMVQPLQEEIERQKEIRRMCAAWLKSLSNDDIALGEIEKVIKKLEGRESVEEIEKRRRSRKG